ncbi:MAG: sigma-54-dependent Fis family transcriptional regulator, partial [Candidatus Hydrogenedentes bacterium]|nr:sigma-54-dependent Fis family transcriptional regulator [Candidatus Hydrogenedentota bacterium]
IDELITVIEDFMGIHSEVNGSLSLPEGVVAESSLMYEVFLQAQKVAQTNTTVLLFGESGVGKEIVASFIYQMSNRAADPWTVVDCSTLTENLVESELFGHAKGAFTGAEQARNGRLLQADGGTLFFDEIGELPLTLQPKLLRVLETGSFSPLGSDQEITVDVRFLAATNRNLKVEVEEGRFREDLYYRLIVFPIEIPPLRLRREDIPLLASLILKTHRKLLTPAAERHLMAYDWPGNIRELRNVLERAAILTEGSRILPESLPPMVRRKKELPADEQDLVIDTMAEIERKAIFEALEKTEGNKTKASELLGISRRSLIYKLRAYEKEGKAKPAPSE